MNLNYAIVIYNHYLSDTIDYINQSILSYLKETKPLSYFNLIHFSKNYSFLKEWILDKTTDLPIHNDSFRNKIHWILNNLIEYPKCKNCGKLIYSVDNTTGDYRTYCSRKCANNSYRTKLHRTETCKRKYGKAWFVEHTSFKAKSKLTNKSRYGVEYAIQSEVVKNKSRESLKTKYNCTNAFQIDHIRQRQQSSYQQHREQIQSKQRLTKLTKYGDKNYNNREKAKSTMLAKYGFDSYAKTNDFVKFHKKEIEYNGQTYDSNWEVLVAKYCDENGVEYEYQPNISFEYEYDGKKHYYHPDFLINGKLYEVKGDHFFRINESTGEEEMICPFKQKDWSDEQYDYVCNIYNEKFKCMKQNGVVVLRNNELRQINEGTYHFN